MARIRTIKPEFFTSEDIVSLDPMARLLYIALWCEADREGRLAWKPLTFKMRYFPADDCDIHALCDALLTRGLLVTYASDGLQYAVIPSFKSHQHVNPREAASTIPEPTQNKRVSGSKPRRVPDACPTREQRVPDAQVGKERKEYIDSSLRSESLDASDENGNPVSVEMIDDDADPNWFQMFWDAYPPRAGDRKRAESEKKFGAAVKRGTDPRAIIAGAERYRAYCDATQRTKTEYVQQATTWLNNRAWNEPFEIPPDAPSPPQRGSRRESPSEVYARLEAECRQRNQARGAA
jgi:hypothetical protein